MPGEVGDVEAPVAPFGDAAVLVPVADWRQAADVARRVRARDLPGVLEVVPGLRSVVALVDPHRTTVEEARARVVAVLRESGVPSEPVRSFDREAGPTRHVVPVVFEGPDLAEVAHLVGVSPEAVVDELTSAELEVSFLGFSPGFAYLQGLPPRLAALARRDTPRPAVPPGSVALAGGFAGVYPGASPGGWHLVGRTGEALFDPDHPPHVRWAPRDRVRFERASSGTATSVTTPTPDTTPPDRTPPDPTPPDQTPPDQTPPDQTPPDQTPPDQTPPDQTPPDQTPPDQTPPDQTPPDQTPPGDGGVPSGIGAARRTRRGDLLPGAAVMDPGFSTTFQDAGRVGVGHLGVPHSGAADPHSLALANRLVGNRPGMSALEITLRGPRLRAERALFVAVVGGRPEVRIDGHPVRHDHVLPLASGQVLEVGGIHDGFRAYLAVAGGFAVATVLGSASRDELAGLGPDRLRAGQLLHVGPASGPLGGHLLAPGPEAPTGTDSGGSEAAGGGRRVLRVLPGPHADRFPRGVLELLAVGRYRVGPDSNRVGLRLRPEPGTAPIPRLAGEIEPQAMVTGAVQVPPDGQPVILLPDHGTHGGYPVVAVVVAADLGALGQCAPGDGVAFRPVDPAGAARALAELEQDLDGAVTGIYPIVAG